jgi:hypothetical protein
VAYGFGGRPQLTFFVFEIEWGPVQAFFTVAALAGATGRWLFFFANVAFDGAFCDEEEGGLGIGDN